MLCCCCCWPAYRCAISLAILDTIIVALLWFRSVDLLFSAFTHTDFIDVLVFIVLFGLFVCESLATGALVVSYRRQIANYVSPRLVLLGGQLSVAVLACILIILYFGGLSRSINDFIIASNEYWSGLKLTEEERKIAYNELSTYVAGLFVLLLVFAVYNILEIYITRKYQKCIETSGEFIPVSRTDRLYNSGAHGAVTFGGFPVEKPIERPPPYNPDYAPAPPYRR
uniref:MARVEL domain-containing protein n=1 Tax=Ascaris lumbricoides TaxID=6252 RepID=A0A0M3IDU1_ASCLU